MYYNVQLLVFFCDVKFIQMTFIPDCFCVILVQFF